MAAPARGLLIHILLFCSHPARTPPKRTERGGGWDPHCLANNSPRNRNGIEVTWENTAHQKERWRRGARGDPSFGRRGGHLRPRCARGAPSPRSPAVSPLLCYTRRAGGGGHRAQSHASALGRGRGPPRDPSESLKEKSRGGRREAGRGTEGRKRTAGREARGTPDGLRAHRPPGRRPGRSATCGTGLAGREGRGAPGGTGRPRSPCPRRPTLRTPGRATPQTRARRPVRPARARSLTSGTRRSPPPAGPRSRSRRPS